MRAFTSFTAVVVAVLVGLVTVPLLWVSVNVADEDGYVDLSEQLVTDRALQTAFADYLADDFVRRGVLPGRLQDTAGQLMAAAARQATDDPGFVDAWAETQRSAHQSAFGDDEGPVTVRIAPLAALVTNRIAGDLPVTLQVPSDLVVPVGTEADRSKLAWVGRSQTFALLGLMVVLVAAATSLVVARRRPVALAGLGLGALAVAGGLRLATEYLAPRLVDRVEGATEFSRTIQSLLISRAADSLVGWLGWIAIVGAGAVVVGALARLVTGRSDRLERDAS